MIEKPNTSLGRLIRDGSTRIFVICGFRAERIQVSRVPVVRFRHYPTHTAAAWRRDAHPGLSCHAPSAKELHIWNVNTRTMGLDLMCRYPGVASRVAQVECIFQEIEDMCFIKTGTGMKSVMRAELTVVEAILQVMNKYVYRHPRPPCFYKDMRLQVMSHDSLCVPIHLTYIT